MEANGYQLREAIRRAKLRRDALKSMFEDSLSKFKDETKHAMRRRVLRAEIDREIAQVDITGIRLRPNLFLRLIADFLDRAAVCHIEFRSLNIAAMANSLIF